MRPRILLATTAATLLVSGTARAAPPSAESFDIRYYTTDQNGERARQMTVQDLSKFINKARCECGQAVSARVRLNGSTGPVDNVQIQTFVGNQCDQGQLGNNVQAQPCPIAFDGFTNAYTRNVDFNFNPLWLSAGVTRDSPRNIEDAIAAGSCENGQGNGGVWICAEDGAQSQCQPSEFVVTGTQNLNSAGATGEDAPQGIRFDFIPPQKTVSNFRFSEGDGKILVSWTNESSGAIDGGFRVLCAQADGSPVPGKGFSLGNVTDQNNSTIYFTASNLCPDGPFDVVEQDPQESTTGFPLPGTGTGGGTFGTGGGTFGTFGTGGGTFQGFADPADPQLGGAQDCCVAGTAPSCSNSVCADLVCQQMPQCCDTEWTQACADLAGATCATCGGAGDCCYGNSTAGCNDAACQEMICETNPSCCKDTWSGDCASAAQLSCAACMDDSTTGDPPGSSGAPPDTGAATATDTDTDTATDGDTDTDTDGALPSTGILSLDWAYVCGGYLAPNAQSAEVTGLRNGEAYQVVVVAYDLAGNPAVVSQELDAEIPTVTPRETTDFWEQCEGQGAICGIGGYCNCRAGDDDEDGGAVLLMVVVALGLRRRRLDGRAA